VTNTEPARYSAIFLDRDGTLNRKAPEGEYVLTWDAFEVLPGTYEALRILDAVSDQIFVVTNQRGVARELMSQEDLDDIHTRFRAEATSQGVKALRIYVCPHDLDAGCKCRKPQPGLLEEARRDHPSVRFETSVVIGDSLSDVEVGKAVGTLTVLVGEQQGDADASFPTLLEAAHWLEDRRR
jgi:D-glycero-D-manno-heptose 1,7-bisphosphate phosphatase